MTALWPLALLLLAAGCAGSGLRYRPASPPYAVTPDMLAPIGAVEFADLSGGVRTQGVELRLERPFLDYFRDSMRSRLEFLGIRVSPGADATLRFEVTSAELQRRSEDPAELMARIKYTIRVLRNGETACVKDVSAWTVVRERFSIPRAKAAMSGALTKAVDFMAAGLAGSCLRTEPAR